jgi:lipoprotein-releasing system ATP-binding protein
MATNALLKLVNVSKTYDAPDRVAPNVILNEISFELLSGESLAIVGPSGSGKSTLLQIIGTLDRPTRGQVILADRDLSGFDEISLAKVRNHDIGFVFQSHYLLPHCTALENVLVPTLAFRDSNSKSTEVPEQRAKRLLARVGLGNRFHHHPGQLSGGERQRVALVRALINSPGLLLADEPTGSLDQVSANSMGELLIEMNREEAVTMVVVTHAIDLANRMHRVYELHEGRLVHHGNK